MGDAFHHHPQCGVNHCPPRGCDYSCRIRATLAQRDRELAEVRAAHDETKRKLAEQAAVIKEARRLALGDPAGGIRYLKRTPTPGAEALRAHVERETADVRETNAVLTHQLANAEAKVETLRGAAEAYDRARYGGPEGIVSGERSDIAWSRVLRALRDTAPDSPSDDEDKPPREGGEHWPRHHWAINDD